MKRYLFLNTADNSLRWSEKVVRGKGMKGVCLEAFEIEIFKKVSTHKIMPANMIHEMYLIHRPTANSKAISNRLSKLVKAKILYQRKHASFFNNINFSFFYTVGETGYRLLKSLDTSKLQLGNSFYDPSRVRIPNLHNLYAVETMHRLFIESRSRIGLHDIQIERGDVYELLKSKSAFIRGKSKSEENPIIPDYVITKGDAIVFFESDMTTETAKQIRKKGELYCQVKQREVFQDKQLYVVYSVVDEKRSGDVGDNNVSRARRIHSLKAAHSPAKEWPDGLEFYVTSSNEVTELILDLLLPGNYPLATMYKMALLSDVNEEMSEYYRQQNGWQEEELETEDLLVDKRKADILPSPMCAMRTFTRKGTVKTTVYLAGEFGSVRTYQELQTLTKLFTFTNETVFMQQYLPIEIVVGYSGTIDLTKEYFGFTPTLPIQLVNSDGEEKRGLQLVTAYKKEWKDW